MSHRRAGITPLLFAVAGRAAAAEVERPRGLMDPAVAREIVSDPKGA